jgi:hypothetical protein
MRDAASLSLLPTDTLVTGLPHQTPAVASIKPAGI